MNLGTNYLFTYGTLMQGFENPFAQKLRAFSSMKAKGYFHGRLYRIDWYPGALYDPAAPSKVFGEIYLLQSPAILDELDEYEEVLDDEKASLYVRRIVPVISETGAEIACWTYLYNQPTDGLSLIGDGRFAG
jgi:gamma-glutamylcyclotransferase (GGCT)/AIG2-like uncharacterized protein YtfP